MARCFHHYPLSIQRFRNGRTPRAVFAVALAFAGCATVPDGTAPGSPWPAADALGRPLTMDHRAPGTRSERAVGIFYFLTHSDGRADPPNDITRILAQDPLALSKPDSPLWASANLPYYWAEPLFGYYDSMDPWVLRRHASLLSDAGIDTVIFDTTNRQTYRRVYMKLCEVWTQIRREGGRTPQICFMVNAQAGETAREIYRDLYLPGLYRDLWFRWRGKPLLICDPKEASPEVRQFFTLRKAHWPFTLVNTHNEWHWESTYPQVFSYDQDPTKPEEVNVAVAQNLRASDGHVTNMSQGNARGRSFHDGKKDTSPGAVDRGYNFEEQWKRAIELDPPFVMVTGWNEWTAGRQQRPGLPIAFVDQYNQEYSRDIEPVTGLHTDNYYYQLVDGVRRFKGFPELSAATPEKSIHLASGFGQWRGVGPEFLDRAFDNDPRDAIGRATHFANGNGRNDLISMKVARDASTVYFYARTRQPITPSTDPNWMWLLIDIDRDWNTGWQGYDFIVNRSVEGSETWLEKNVGGWKWEKVAKLKFKVSGNELMVAVPRSALGLPDGVPIAFDFKWWDNAQSPGDIMDVYLSGDTAPDGRFNYRYRTLPDKLPDRSR